MPISRPLRAAITAAALLAAGTAALAQTPGTYTGTTAQGQPVTLVIGAAAPGGRPMLTFVQVGFAQACQTTGRTITTGYAVGANVPVGAQGDIHRKLFFTRAYGTLDANFDGVATYSGTTSVFAAYLQPALPLQAENCNALDVPFTATLSSPSAP